ncbi:MAG: phosphatidylserine decarboxylase [Chlorobiaceae bacterium]|nr:phosphatidylserine decarboxylase [Chlorobiaceae bacterium]
MRISIYGTGSVIRTAALCFTLFIAGLFLPQPGGGAVSAAALFFILFTLFFYRDPEREIPSEPGLVIAPADGRIVITQHVNHPVTGADSTLVSIFMSPFDVHVNRIPIDGRVLDVRYVPGKFLMAFDHRSMTDNERMEITLQTAAGTVWFSQVSGFVARRIVCGLEKGQQISAGERFGMIKLGSRVDIVLPPTIQVTASIGKRTIAGETLLGRACCF